MNPVAIRGTGLVTSVGWSTEAACAAIRAKIANPVETAFVGRSGEPIAGHVIPALAAIHGFDKMVAVAANAALQALRSLAPSLRSGLPLLLCSAEAGRPGRTIELERELFAAIERASGLKFSSHSRIFAEGRVGVVSALREASRMLTDGIAPLVAIVAADSLLTGPMIRRMVEHERLLCESNSNGFMPGEAAAALLVGPISEHPELRCEGCGTSHEDAALNSGLPLRGQGLSRAVAAALESAGCNLQQIDVRITDASGEQYYFKEAALAIARLLRGHRQRLDHWHPAECTGEVGAAVGPIAVTVADVANRKGYSPGPLTLCHFGTDAGARAALVLRYHRGAGIG